MKETEKWQTVFLRICITLFRYELPFNFMGFMRTKRRVSMKEPKAERQSFSVADPSTYLTVRTPVSRFLALKKRAYDSGMSTSKLINEAIAEYLAKETAR